ncbi:AraC family transcriptional regulator [Pleionea sp. CnH1-48]|uniref:helix-turn-helix domain-containing protein n=1 Tax=Pleionea sp. CnH1-48 TaxID=2954494 RepID=UPI0020971CBA|nr:helix-turn-helix transcriptional regulator [Pleionea sp. CnH1-48]MCO7223750.1 helix-turn-helix transcriptional regulator [Pleionea sp. CnH1-48]
MGFSLLESIILLGGIQGIFLSSVLLFSPRHRKAANLFLGLFVLAFSINILRNILEAHGYLANFDIVRVVSLGMPALYGPLIYLYVVAAISVTATVKPNYGKHFILAAVYLGVLLSSALLGVTDWPEAERYPWLIGVFSLLVVLVVIQTLVYFILAVLRLRRLDHELELNFSSVEGVGMRWIKKLLLAFIGLFLIWVLVFGADLRILNVHYPEYVFQGFWLAMAVLVYWMGYYSMLKPEVLTFELQTTKKKSSISIEPDVVDRVGEQLTLAMEEDKLYLNSELSLKQLAEHLQLNAKKVSHILNSRFDKTFYAFVNEYRIEAVKRCLENPDKRFDKLEGIAYDCGFKSSSTFNRLFKQYENMTPKAYREQKLG